MRFRHCLPACALAFLAAAPALAQSSAFPAGRSYIVQMSSSQAGSGYAQYLAGPLVKAMNATGLVSKGAKDAEFAATLDTTADVGKWFGKGEARRWLYTRKVLVGLSPANYKTPPLKDLTEVPAFGVTASLITENEDRTDELACLVDLATKTLAARYTLKGRVAVDGQGCKR